VPDTIRVAIEPLKASNAPISMTPLTPLSAARGHLKRNTATTAMAQGLFTNLHLRQLDKLD
jgi:hypothetical protein